MNRRALIASLIAMPAAIESLAAAEPDQPNSGPILGPAVFAWDETKPAKTATGEVRQLCKQPTATLAELEMHITTLDPGHESHPPHRHVNEELIILREGHCETLSNGTWIKVEPGSVVFNASNSLHGFRNIGTTPAVYTVINWSPNHNGCGGAA